MSISSTGETPRFLRDGQQRGDALTITSFIEAPSQRVLRTGLLVLLTLAAGCTDALCYLSVGRVFASFMTGNLLFLGISIVQGNTALLVRASVAVLLFLVSVTLGSLYLQSLRIRQTAANWRESLARYLLGEGLILLVFAVVWSLTGALDQHPTVQVVLLGIAALGMGMQGALCGALNILDVSTVALTGTELLLGIRLAQRIGGQARPHGDRPAGTSAPFLAVLLLSYTVAALVVALAISWIATVFIPCFLIAVAVILLAAQARTQSLGSVHTASTSDAEIGTGHAMPTA